MTVRVAYTQPPKSLPALWNKTTLIRICVEDAGADHLFSIQGTIFLMPLMLLKTIFHKVDVEI